MINAITLSFVVVEMAISIRGLLDRNPFSVNSTNVIRNIPRKTKLQFRASFQRCWAFLSVVFPKLGKSRRILPLQSETQYSCQSETALLKGALQPSLILGTWHEASLCTRQTQGCLPPLILETGYDRPPIPLFVLSTHLSTLVIR